MADHGGSRFSSSLSPEQCRGARAMLAISAAGLAASAQVARPTITRFETGRSIPWPSNLAAIRRALEAAGIEFLAHNGVRLRRE